MFVSRAIYKFAKICRLDKEDNKFFIIDFLKLLIF